MATVKTPDQPTLNVDLARRVITYARKHPEQHSQYGYATPNLPEFSDPDDVIDPLDLVRAVQPVEGEYRCMTAACIAGWAVVLAGPDAVAEAYEDEDVNAFDPWFDLGRKLLGLDYRQASDIFLDMDNERALENLEALTG